MTAAITLDAVVRRGELTLDLTGDGAVAFERGLTTVTGPNGVGKTTLLRTVAGLEAISTGQVHVGGAVVDDPAAEVFVASDRRGAAMVFQEHRLFGHLRVIDNVGFPRRRRGAGREPAREAARQWLDRLGIGDLAMMRPQDLSGGQRQRVAIARALATPDPTVVLLDEPLANIDAGARDEVRALITSLADVAVVWVTHDPEDAERGRSRIVMGPDGVRQTHAHD